MVTAFWIVFGAVVAWILFSWIRSFVAPFPKESRPPDAPRHERGDDTYSLESSTDSSTGSDSSGFD